MACSQFSVSCVIFDQKSKLQRWGGASRAELGPQRSPTNLVQLTFQSFTFQRCTLREGLSFSWFGKWSRWFLMCFFFSSLQHTESDFKSRLKSRPELEELRAQVSWGAGEHSVHSRAIPGNARLIFLSCSSLQKVDFVSSVLTRRNFHRCEASLLWILTRTNAYLCVWLLCTVNERGPQWNLVSQFSFFGMFCFWFVNTTVSAYRSVLS